MLLSEPLSKAIFSCKRRPSSQHLVENATKTVYVRSGVDLTIADELLRTHISRRSRTLLTRSCKLTHSSQINCARNTEVRDYRMLARKKDVLGFDIAMNNALLVRVIEPVRGLTGDAHSSVDFQLVS